VEVRIFTYPFARPMISTGSPHFSFIDTSKLSRDSYTQTRSSFAPHSIGDFSAARAGNAQHKKPRVSPDAKSLQKEWERISSLCDRESAEPAQ
jgi:hypothetical protein